jgi:hypothetical protein
MSRAESAVDLQGRKNDRELASLRTVPWVRLDHGGNLIGGAVPPSSPIAQHLAATAKYDTEIFEVLAEYAERFCREGYHREVASEGSVEQTCESKRRERRTSGQRTAKSISIKDAKRRSDDYARKAAQLTPGDFALCRYGD